MERAVPDNPNEASQSGKIPRWFHGMGNALRDAVLIAGLSAVLALLVNLVHPERIPFVAEQEYETMVPCPVFGGEVVPLDPGDPALHADQTFVVDARAKAEHDDWHFGDAMNVPYDYLDPTPEDVIQELARRIARSRAQRVVVYGDGQRPDTGEQLGKEISGHGIKNVHFVKGGAPSLREQPAGPKP
jgi:hypothetical protein